jgi:hypothetical protein
MNQTLNLKIISLPILLLITCFTTIAQTTQSSYEPKILILSPAQSSVDPSLEKELKAQNDSIAKIVDNVKANANALAKQAEGQPPNIQLMIKNSQAFIMHMDFFKQVDILADDYLTYKFYERFPNVLILVKDTTISSQIKDFQLLASQQQMPYIISFPKLNLTMENGQRLSRITVQLYEQDSNSFLINKEYTGNERNPGFEFNCHNGTINCTINNALSGALQDIIEQIAANNSTLKRERQLSIERADEIKSNLFRRAYDPTLVSNVISKVDNGIDLDLMYQCLYNGDKTQFVAFFTKTGVNNKFKSLNDKMDKGKVDIITSKDIHDPGYLDSIPKTYAYIVKGVLYNGKWYYQKDQITYFDAPSLDDGRMMYLSKLEAWNYFKESSTNFSPGFWSGSLFGKVPDRKKDPKWEKYKEMWAMEEREDRDYIGLYEMVAEQLKAEKKDGANGYRKYLSDNVLRPFFKEQAIAKLNHIVKFDAILNDFELIYPKDRHLVLSPVKLTDEKGDTYIRFFVVEPATKHIYEWTYFKPYLLNKGYSDEPITKMIGSLTQWNFSYDNLDDADFWNNYVLTKDGNDYKYLKVLK